MMKWVNEFGMAPDGLMIVSKNINEVKSLSDKLSDLDSVKKVESIADYYLDENDYNERTPIINSFIEDLNKKTLSNEIDIEELENQLIRLEINLIELGDLAYMGNLDRLVVTLDKMTGINEDGKKTAETSFDSIYNKLDKGIDEKGVKKLVALQESVYKNMHKRLIKWLQQKK